MITKNDKLENNVTLYELIGDDKVIVKTLEGKVRMKNIYHLSKSGCLCDDFDTYIDFEQADATVFG